ncbi:hypothetical protein QYF36_011711 [Acer negundo]|nr:hypothetical protein QYF36_011711 [Acer negundo]
MVFSTSFEFHLSNMIFNFLSDLDRLIFVFWSWWCDGLTSRVIPTLVAATLLAISLYAWLIKKPFTSVPPLPPGPPGLPLLGNLPFLEPNLHRYSARLSEIYGPIMKLQLGSKLCVVISSPSLAKQVLKDNDAIFANRDPTVAAKAGTYGEIDILWSPSHDPKWRKLPDGVEKHLYGVWMKVSVPFRKNNHHNVKSMSLAVTNNGRKDDGEWKRNQVIGPVMFTGWKDKEKAVEEEKMSIINDKKVAWSVLSDVPMSEAYKPIGGEHIGKVADKKTLVSFLKAENDTTLNEEAGLLPGSDDGKWNG